MRDQEQIVAEKARLRAEFRSRREALGAEARAQASAAICDRLAALVGEAGARTVSGFWPLPGEVDLRPILARWRDSGVTLVLPVTASPAGDAPRLIHRVFRETRELVRGPFGVLEPPPSCPDVPPDALDVAVVPALALGRDGTRLGYGGGFYDSFLALTEAVSIGVAFSPCLAPSLPTEPHDARLATVVTERETWRVRRNRSAQNP